MTVIEFVADPFWRDTEIAARKTKDGYDVVCRWRGQKILQWEATYIDRFKKGAAASERTAIRAFKAFFTPEKIKAFAEQRREAAAKANKQADQLHAFLEATLR